jgi:SPP1 gp7 family putative phage head morphogenesis protein
MLAFDKKGGGKGPSKYSAFIRARKAEEGYARQLRKIARHIGDFIRGTWKPDDLESSAQITDMMGRYARSLVPWAEAIASLMVADVAARDRGAWRKTAAEMGKLLGKEIDSAPTGHVLRQRMADQVSLITSLPTEAAERVHKLTLEGITQGRRAEDIAKEIARSGHVTMSRANLIARTEVGRTATELTKARAEHVGSTHFVWRTAGDSDVRETHRRLNGKVFRWDDPPECDPGVRALPGSSYNCRCFAAPIIPD